MAKTVWGVIIIIASIVLLILSSPSYISDKRTMSTADDIVVLIVIVGSWVVYSWYLASQGVKPKTVWVIIIIIGYIALVIYGSINLITIFGVEYVMGQSFGRFDKEIMPLYCGLTAVGVTGATICIAMLKRPAARNEETKTVETKALTSSMNYPAASSEGKDWLVTLLLAIFVGGLGIHRFYTGHTGTAIAILLLSLLGSLTFIFYIGAPMLLIVGVWVLVDIIRIAIGSFTDVNGNVLIKR